MFAAALLLTIAQLLQDNVDFSSCSGVVTVDIEYKGLGTVGSTPSGKMVALVDASATHGYYPGRVQARLIHTAARIPLAASGCRRCLPPPTAAADYRR